MPPHHKRGGTRHQSYLLAASFIWEKVCNYSSSQPFLVGKKKKKSLPRGAGAVGILESQEAFIITHVLNGSGGRKPLQRGL